MSVRHALLGLLARRPRHGYELRAAFEAMVGGEQNWDVKPAQVYTTLERLAQAHLVVEEADSPEAAREKRVYAITPAGRAALQEWFAAGVERGHQRDELFLKLVLCLVSGEGDPRQVIRAQRAQLYRELHSITTQRNNLNPRRDLARVLLFSKAEMHLEAELRWLDMTEARLDEMRRQPLPEPALRPRGRPRKLLAPTGKG